MKKILLLAAFIVSVYTTNTIYAQNYSRTQQQKTTSSTSSGFDKSKLTFGGGFGMQFGNYTLINIAPQVGYNFSQYFNAGAGISYSYYKDDFYIYGEPHSQKWDEKRHYLGMNVYARVYPIQYIVLSVQPEANRMWETLSPKGGGRDITEEKFVPSCVLGAGVRMGPMTAMIQYDVVQDDRSPYGNSIFYSVGYTWSF